MDRKDAGIVPVMPHFVTLVAKCSISSILYRTLDRGVVAWGLAGLALAVPVVVVGTAKTQMAALWSGGF